MNSNDLKLKDVKTEELEVVFSNLTTARKAFNNADFITPTDIQRTVLMTVKYYKIALWDNTVNDFNKDLFFSCIYKDTKKLNERWLKLSKMNSSLENTITIIWDKNREFKTKWEDFKNIIKYFEFLKDSWVSKEEAMVFIDSLDFSSEEEPENKKTTSSSIDDEMEMLRKMFDNGENSPFGNFGGFGGWFWK